MKVCSQGTRGGSTASPGEALSVVEMSEKEPGCHNRRRRVLQLGQVTVARDDETGARAPCERDQVVVAWIRRDATLCRWVGNDDSLPADHFAEGASLLSGDMLGELRSGEYARELGKQERRGNEVELALPPAVEHLSRRSSGRDQARDENAGVDDGSEHLLPRLVKLGVCEFEGLGLTQGAPIPNVLDHFEAEVAS